MRLSKYFSDGCVLQRGSANIFGEGFFGERILVEFSGKEYSGVVDSYGKFLIKIDTEAGYNFELSVRGESDAVKVCNINVGDVFICMGQSNMELPISRVRERELYERGNESIREFKVFDNFSYKKHEEFCDCIWRACIGEAFEEVSAMAYFFSDKIYKREGIPIGFVNISKGGAPIESFLPSQLLHESELELLGRFKTESELDSYIESEDKRELDWNKNIDEMERAFLKERGLESLRDFKEFDTKFNVPGYFSEQGYEDFSGLFYMSRKFNLTASDMADGVGKLYLGTISDADRVFLNGALVGETGYKYPPRNYRFDTSLLKEGENEIFIRLSVEYNEGRFTPQKKYSIEFGNFYLDLTGEWEMKMVGRVNPFRPKCFKSNMPTVIYNGMVNPVFRVANTGCLWYQGESNADDAIGYKDYISKLINLYRSEWGEIKPFIITGLPMCETDNGGKGAWDAIRAVCESVGGRDKIIYVDNTDLGEKNDLHPIDKREMGERAAQRYEENK